MNFNNKKIKKLGNLLDDLRIKFSFLFDLGYIACLCAVLAGWGSSLKLLETQKQLQAKKYVLQNVKVRESELCILRY